MTKHFTDQLNRTVSLAAWPPKRIVSLVPSQTELLHELGLENEVVGITKFCVHPSAWFHTKTRVGGTKTVDPEKVAALAPDLIIGNREENERSQIEWLAERYPVWMSDVVNLADALDMIGRIGDLTATPERAQALAGRIRSGFAELEQRTAVHGLAPTAAYIIWRKPYMIAGNGTFIDDMMRRTGFRNVFAHKNRYPEISTGELTAARPDLILLSSEPYPFAEKHLEQFREICPAARVVLTDGEMFSWYGSRLAQAPGYFLRLRESLALA